MFKFINAVFLNPGPKYSWKKVVLTLCISSIALSSITLSFYFFYRYLRYTYCACEGSSIQAIVLTSPVNKEKSAILSGAYFAEILGLCIDCPVSLNQFDIEEAKKRLLSTQIIHMANLKKMKPNVLYIEYSTRTPFLLLEDYSNTGIDREGMLFPYTPFYSPQNLTTLYLGASYSNGPWGEQIGEEYLQLINTLMQHLGCENIQRIDLSHAQAYSPGKREIVVILSSGTILRMTAKNCVQELINYSMLKQSFLKERDAKIIDLRIPEVAYITPLMQGLYD